MIPRKLQGYVRRLWSFQNAEKKFWSRSELLEDIRNNGLPAVNTFNKLIQLGILSYIPASSEESVGCYEVLTVIKV